MTIDSIGIRHSGARVSAQAKRQATLADEQPPSPKSRAPLDFIPSPESLATLINSAVASLRKGIYWDRGSILNVLA